MDRLTLPLFPLFSVLFPGGPLALRIFEPRYLDMISASLREESPFGVCLIRDGEEVGEAAETFDVGTLARITYWNRRRDGLLGVTVRGLERFRILERRVEPSRLLVAEVSLLPAETACAVPKTYAPLVELLRGILEELDYPYANLPREYDNAVWVSARLAELLPLKLAQKQYLLQMDDPLQRLERLKGIIENGSIV